MSAQNILLLLMPSLIQEAESAIAAANRARDEAERLKTRIEASVGHKESRYRPNQNKVQLIYQWERAQGYNSC